MIAVNEYITIDKNVLFGKQVFKGTRVPVETLIDHLEKGIALDEFLEDFPTVRKEQAIAILEIPNTLLMSSNIEKLYETVA
jgi:uncharacterized protein (DUF433 family)